MAARIVFRPLPAWTDPVTQPRQSHNFKASWSDTVDLLRREVGMLTDRWDSDVILQVQTDERALRRDGGIRADAKVCGPGVVVSFESRHGPLRYACDTFEATYWRQAPGWQANVRAVALGLEALRKVDRYGIASRGEQYVGFAPLDAGPPIGEPGGVIIELHDAAGVVVAESVVDPVDAALAAHSWYRLANGYVVRTVVEPSAKTMLYLHREIMGLSTHDGLQVDHIDGDRLNNRRSNLRVVPQSVNAQNRGPNEGRDLPRNVYYVPRRDKYRAQTKLDGKAVHLGDYATASEADAVASRWRAEHMPGSADARLSAAVDSMTWSEAKEVLRRYMHSRDELSTAYTTTGPPFVAVVETLYRRAVKRCHPDVGGDPAEFKRVTMARNLLITEAR